MKDKNSKDEELDLLFKKYMSEEISPDENSVLKAKEYMSRSQAEEYSSEYAIAGTNGKKSHNNPFSGFNFKNFLFAALMLFLGALIAWLFIPSRERKVSDSGDGSIYSAYENSLSVNYAEYTGKAFIPFVDGKNISSYKEYSLIGGNGEVGNGEVVRYFLEYDIENGTKANLFVYHDNISFPGVDSLEDSANRQIKEGGISFKMRTDPSNNLTDVFFNYNSYSYNLRIYSADENFVKSELRYISNCFLK